MARRRVTYREVADARPRRTAAVTLLELAVDPPAERPSGMGRPGGLPVRRPPAPPRPRRGRWVAGAVALLVGAVAFGLTGTGADEPEAAPTSTVTHRVVAREGPVVVAARSVVAEPWSGVFEHHPDARGEVSVPHVHLAAFSGPAGRALLVVDATRRAFGRPAQRGAADRPARVLGPEEGRGLRSLQWDDGGYGLSLTSVGLSVDEQRLLAGAVRLPPGASLRHGRPPSFDAGALTDVGMSVTERRSGAASALGSPLIGQTGGASIEGQLHQQGARPLLVSVVEDQLVSASRVRRALGSAAEVDVRAMPDVARAAVLAHGPGPEGGRRIEGWTRLVLDHVHGVTIELSSDVLGPDELVEAAQAIDLARLARTTAPLGASGG